MKPPRARALDLLARREHSRAELRRKLAGDDIDDATLDAVLDRLVADGLQSDARFTETFVRSRAGRGDGPLKIGQELRRRGIAGTAAEAALEDADIDWDERLEAARSKRFGHPPPTDLRERARQARFLAQRGFTGESIRKRLTDVG